MPGTSAISFSKPAQIGGSRPAPAGVLREIPRVRSRPRDPRNDSGVRSLAGAEPCSIIRRPWTLPMDLASYISGFIDGEGCFCVSFQPSKRHRFGWEVRPSFSVSQNADRSELFEELKARWGCGHIRPDRSDKTLKYEVRNVRNLVEHVLPHFRAYPLLSSKQSDVERFDRICRLIIEGKHRDADGFEEIVRIATAMNPSGKRKYSGSDILASLRSGEGIVCAAGNCGVHEVPTCTNGVTT